MSRFGGIEAGGTKFVCGVGSDPNDLETIEFPTTTPDETIQRVADFFRSRAPVEAIGIGSFGPIDRNPQSPTFGYITTTPKLSWRNFDFAGAVREALGVLVSFDTDVNAAALAEFHWGAAQGIPDFVYITVGTGVGGGAVVNGRLLSGERQHPEMGHIRVPHDRERDPFPGNCPYHGDCLEGLIAAPALEARWGQSPRLYASNHPAWDLVTDYLALGLVAWTCTLCPERIVLGGGIMQRAELSPRLQCKLEALLNGYIAAPVLVPAGLGTRAGVLGGIVLAARLPNISRHN